MHVDTIQISIELSEAIVHATLYMHSLFPFQFSFTGHQGISQSDPCTITGFGSFKLQTCDWLQKGRSHSHYGVQPGLVVT